MLAASRLPASAGLAATAGSAWSPSRSCDTCTAAAGWLATVVLVVAGCEPVVGGVLRGDECSVHPPPITAARLRPVAASTRVRAIESRMCRRPFSGCAWSGVAPGEEPRPERDRGPGPQAEHYEPGPRAELTGGGAHG